MKQMSNVWRRIAANDVARSIVGVGSATALSQLIALGVSPLLSRLYPQAVFGAFSAFFAFANILAALCLAGLNDAVIAAHDDDEALMLARLGSWLLAGLLLPAGLLSLAAIDHHWFGLGELPRWAAALLVAELICLVFGSYYQSLLVRFRRFNRVSHAYLSNGIGRAGGQLGGGVAAAGLLGMGGGELLGRAVAAWLMRRALLTELARSRRFTASKTFEVLRLYRHFPIARTPSAVASAIAVGAPPLMMVALFGARDAGLFALMVLALSAPLALIQRSVGDVFLGHFSHRFRVDRALAMRLLWQMVIGLGAIAALGAAILLVAGPSLFALVFGPQWAAAGAMARVAVPMLVTQLLVLPVATAITVANRPEVKIVYDVLYLAALAIGWHAATVDALSAIDFVWLLSVLTAGVTILYFGLVLWACHHPRLRAAAAATA